MCIGNAHRDLAALPSRRNRLGLTTDDKGIEQFVAELTDRANDVRKRRFTEKEHLSFKQCLMGIVLDLLSASKIDSDLWVGYSCGKPAYRPGGAC